MGGGSLTRRLGQLLLAPVKSPSVEAFAKREQRSTCRHSLTKRFTRVFSQDTRIVSPWRDGTRAT
jgi:hypothetical protein